jgi:hypothetical protein
MPKKKFGAELGISRPEKNYGRTTLTESAFTGKESPIECLGWASRESGQQEE